MQALGRKVVILPIPVDNKTKGGIIIPDTVQEKPSMGTVKSIGPACDQKLKDRVKPGDTVYYSSNAGDFLEPFLIMDEDHVWFVVK